MKGPAAGADSQHPAAGVGAAAPEQLVLQSLLHQVHADGLHVLLLPRLLLQLLMK
jgi:hypothetical protein